MNYRNLKNKYSVLDLLHEAEYPSKNEFSVLTLGDKRNISPELATEFAGQLKQLADETVSKVDNKALNYEISEYFKIFSEVLLFQHGAGYSLDGINNVLNIKKITELLDKFGQKFIEQELSKENPSALTEVKKHVLDRTAIKNFTNTIADDVIEVNEEEGPNVTSSNDVQIISEDYGVVQVETNPTKEETQTFIELIKPQIKAQTYKENKGTFANEMFHYGLMWARTNPKAAPVKIQKFEGVNNNYYNYHALDQNGNPLPSIKTLQPIIDKIQETLGIDMSNYDSVIGNIYLDNQYVYPHKDTTESITARNYPVVVYTIGNNAGLGIVDNNQGKLTFANSYNSIYLPSGDKLKGYTNEVLTKNGTIYTFGMDGKGRFELTHSTPTNSKKTGKFPPIILPNGDVIIKYTITLTFRRAADLEPGMPTAPAKLTTTQSIIKPSGTINVYWGQAESETSTRILSNLAPRKFKYESTDGITREYGSVEHAYQSNKNGKFDKAIYDAYVNLKEVANKQGPGYGAKIAPKLTDVGKRGNLQLMKDLVVESFIQNPNSDAAKKLLQYKNFTHNTNELIDKAFLEGLKLAQRELLNAQPSTKTEPKGEKVKEGIYVNQEALTKEEQIELFDYLKPFLEEQASKTNKGANANKMIGLGLRWDYNSNNFGPTKMYPELGDRQPLTIGPNLAGRVTSYGYWNLSINGQPLGPISDRLKKLVTKATGIDVSDYDGAIINIYDEGTLIGNHSDLEESKSAEKYPVVAVNIGGSGNFTVGTNYKDNIKLKPGAGYLFGFNGENRKIPHSTLINKQDGFLPEITTKLDGKTYKEGSYRVTITMRRVMPLQPGMPIEPAIVSTQPSTSVRLKDGNTYTADQLNAKMLLAMGYTNQEAGKIIKNNKC
jgi:alkylated DNA repair dioxygenase AlkB